jgi:hypothetical protein
MQTEPINLVTVLLRILSLAILKPITLPYTIYKNALRDLSDGSATYFTESDISHDFPLYSWFMSVIDALIVLTYPIGLIVALIMGFNSYYGGFGPFVGVILYTYFLPLTLGFLREISQVCIKIILYLKVISKK